MNFKLNKKGIISFFPFVALAMLFWVSSIMTKKSTYSKDIFIEVKTGDDLIIMDTNLYVANVTLSGKGLDLVLVNSYPRKDPLKLKINEKNPEVSSETIIRQLQSEIPSNKIQIVKVLFPYKFIKLEKRLTKTIPIKFNGKISYKKMYGTKGPVVLEPDKTTISGPESWVKDINSWNTESVTYKDLITDVKEKINLEPPKHHKINITPDNVEIYIPVEEYTEKKVVLPVKISGNKNKDLLIVPSSITVSFLIGVSKYEFIDSTEFLASVYVNQDSILNGNYPVSIIKKPSNVTIQYIQPNYVDVYLKN
ncbi:MAG TPA: hypothetical protein ENI82_05895 [Bacteroidetes bacterium]|nr:hypothetical protein [Bacteroidota bacterium]